jgi:hypothetical protein
MIEGGTARKWHLSCRSSVEKDPDCSKHQLIDIVDKSGIRHAQLLS